MTLTPIGIGLLLLWRFESMKSKGQHSDAFSWLLIFLFFIMPAVSSKIFGVYKCQYFKDSKEFWLVADFSLGCDGSSERKIWLAYTSIMVSHSFRIETR